MPQIDIELNTTTSPMTFLLVFIQYTERYPGYYADQYKQYPERDTNMR